MSCPEIRLQLRVESDGIGLEARHRGVAVERMKRSRRVPARSGGQFFAFAERDIPPAELRQMVQNAAADNTAADDQRLDMAFHQFRIPVIGLAFLGFSSLGTRPCLYIRALRVPEAGVS